MRLGTAAIKRAGIGMLRTHKDVLCLSMLNERAMPHHGHPIGNFGYHAEVMGDEHNGGAVPAPAAP